MKKYIFLVVFLCSLVALGQNMIVPMRFEFQKHINQFHINSLTKHLLEKQGFVAFFDDAIPVEISAIPCKNLKINVLNTSGMLVSKLYFELTDCTGKVIFTSKIGKSREKDFKKAYTEALREAFSTSNLTEFKTAYLRENTSKEIVSEKQLTSSLSVLYAQPTTEGFQLVDSTPKVVLRLAKTSLPEVYNATDNHGNQGIFYKKDDYYLFEYQKDSVLQQEKWNVKF